MEDSLELDWREQNAAPTEVVRQHYVPRFYLTGYSSGNSGVPVCDILTAQTFETNPINAGVERGYNDFTLFLDDREIRVSTEDWFGNLETAAAPTLKRIADDPEAISGLDETQERNLARYLAAQLIRVPAFRADLKNTRDQLVSHLKESAQAYLKNTLSPERAATVLAEWMAKPEEWWLQQESPVQDAETVSFLLEKTDGWANLILAMPWRTGFTSSQIYTSDNPVSGLAPATDYQPYAGALPAQRYHFPICKDVLMVFGPTPMPDDKRFGLREFRNFGEWETSIARHVVSLKAHRYLYGPGPYVDQRCAAQCLRRIRQSQVETAVRYLGIDPIRPFLTPKSHSFRDFLEDAPPKYHEVHGGLWAFLNYRKPLGDLMAWTEELIFIVGHESATDRMRQAILTLLWSIYSPSVGEPAVRRAAENAMKEIQVKGFGEYLETDEGKELRVAFERIEGIVTARKE